MHWVEGTSKLVTETLSQPDLHDGRQYFRGPYFCMLLYDIFKLVVESSKCIFIIS